ncbi:T9SS type B sorting domain-containing protein [Mucilaginibacter sp. HD30]
MTHLKTESPFNHWLSKKYFTAVLLCLFALCCFGFEAVASKPKSLTKTMPSKIEVPVVNSFAPNHGPVGTILTINGDYLDDVDHVSIGRIYQLILSKSKTTITAMIMPGTVDGTMLVHKGGGGVGSHEVFLVTAAQPPTNLQNDRLGTAEGASVAISADGNTLVVEPNHYSCKKCTTRPPDSTVVYKRTGSTWSVYANLPNAFNIQISADGKTLTATEYYDVVQPMAGVYVDNGGGQFVRQFELSGIKALSADGNTVLVRNVESQIVAYKRNLGAWTVFGDPIVRADAGFGSHIALNGDANTVLITDDVSNHALPNPLVHPYQPDSLKAWVYVRNGNGWAMQAQLATYPGNAKNAGQRDDPWYWDGPEYQDLTIAISADGNRILFNPLMFVNRSGAKMASFTRTGTMWTKEDAGDIARGVVALSADGQTAASFSGTGIYYTRIMKYVGSAWSVVYENSIDRQPAGESATVDVYTNPPSWLAIGNLSADGSTAVSATNRSGRGGVIVYSNQLATPGGPVSPAQTVSSITPASGPIGSVVTLSGSNLKGIKQFSIGGKPGILISNNGTNILGMVAGGTTSGAVAITNVDSAIITSSTNFNVTASPSIPPSTGSAKFGTIVTTGNTDINQGYSVAISANGTTAVLGAPNYSSGKGALIIFTRNNTGAWVQQGPALVNPYSNPALGVSVAISADGNTVIGGGHKMQGSTNGFLSMRAATVLFSRSGTTWTAAADFGLSEAVALSGDGKIAVLGNVEPNSDDHLAPNAVLTIFAKDSVGNGYTSPPAFYQGAANFISLAFSSSRTLVVGKPMAFTTPGRGGSTFYGSAGVIYNIDDLGFPTAGGTNLQSALYLGQNYEASRVAISGDGRVLMSGGVATSPVTFRRNDDGTWTDKSKMLGADFNGGFSLNVDGTVALVVKDNGALFYKWNGTDWGTPLTALPNTSGLSAVSLTPDATKALLGLAYDPNGGAAQVFENTMPPAPLAVAPTLSTTKLVFTNTTFNSTTVSWTKGNGAKRAVFIARTANGVAAPINDVTYTANTAFGAGTQIGATGWYAIYNGDASSVDITGLASNATYRVTVVEYNGVSGDEKYLQKNLAPASVVTPASPNDPPTVPSLQLTFSNTTATTTNVSWVSGNGAMRAVFVAKTANGVAAPVNDNIYTANVAFGTGSQIGGTGWYCVYNGTGNSTDISGLDPLSTYRVTVVDYNNTGAPKYINTKLAPASVSTLTSPSVTPTIPSLKLTFDNIAPTSTTVNWVSGNGSRRAVFIARRADGVAAPIDNTTYSANANFPVGTQIGTTGWYCVYDGTGSSANIIGLTPNTTYRVTVVDYNGAAGTQKYINSKLAPAIVTTASTSPTIPSLKLTFTNTTASTTNVSWISGNGAMRAVFVARTANGVANAVNNITYTANQNFAVGTQIGSTGWYCVYNGSGNTTNITALDANTTYRVTVIEYNGGSGAQLYTNDKLNPAIVTTIPAGPVQPTAPSLSLNFSNTTGTATTVSWTSGNGFRRAVFVARRSGGVAAPMDNTPYMGNPTFGAGAQIGSTGWYCVYNEAGNSADITGLTPGTTYRVTVVDFNGSIGSEKYMNSRLAPASVITATGSGLRLAFTSLKSDTPADELGVSEIEASNILSPNGDGKNDTWMVKNIEQYQNNSVAVYDQGSNVVYTKKGYTNDWAGTYRGGVVKEGTYYYLIDLGNGTTKKGFITVLSSRQ